MAQGDGRRIRARSWLVLTVLLGLLVVTLDAVSPATVPGPEVVGSWTAPFDLGLIAIHATQLPNDGGKVLLVSARGPSVGSAARVWDSSNGTLKDVSLSQAYDMMCGGNTMLPDGRPFFAGGRSAAEHTAMFNPATETWTLGPSMAAGRYYPTTTELADGRVLIFYGQSNTVEQYDPATNTITMLPTSANRSNVLLYPRLEMLPDGRLFQAGQEQQTMLFAPATNTWTPFGQMSSTRAGGATVLLPGLNKVLAVGGNKGASTVNTADIMDFSSPSPQWRPTASMHVVRQDFNALLLPDGTVMAIGGKGGATPPKQPEIFDPVTETWSSMTAQVAQRAYHSTALLLPDGRVLSAGDGDGPSLERTGEVFSPPYLFKGPRPVINSVSATDLGYGQSFTINTDDANNISRVALIKPGPVSHGVNFDQRYIDLGFTRGAGEISATSPSGGTVAPPGWYMLFVLNSAGVPSVASWVHVANTGPPVCTPAPPTATGTPAAGASVPAGTPVDYTISVKNNDSLVCPPSSFDLQATVPSGWQGTLSTSSLTLAPGATGTATLHATSPAGAASGSYPMGATTTRSTNAADTASASMTYTIAPAGGGGGSFADNFDRATLGPDWVVLPNSAFSIVSNELRNGAVAGLHRAVVSSVTGADETVAATFATTNQSTGAPTLGFLLRYQDPSNYYLLYRQVGGSSVLRIARVVNGVTTVLASASVPNPQVNVGFPMTASATGGTLKLTLGNVKVSASDATFASGGVGLVLGSTGAAVSHRANDFSAAVQ